MLERLNQNQIETLEKGIWITTEQMSILGFDDQWIESLQIEKAYLKLETDYVNDFYFFSMGTDQNNDNISNRDYNPIDPDDLIEELLEKGII